jgi:hypothetical protein
VSGGGWVPRPAPTTPATDAAEPEGAALRVLLVSRDAMLAEALEALVDEPGEVRTLDWRADSLELALHGTDVVVLDVPPSLHQRSFAVIDGRFLGRTVVLLQEGESAEALPPGPSRVVLYRPLQISDLWAAVTGVVQPAVAAPAAPNGAGPVVAPPEPPAEAVSGAGPAAEASEAPTPAPMIGLSGRVLEPVVGPGQVAPGMDPDTLERLRRWHERAGSVPAAEPEAPPAAPSGPDGPTGRAARPRPLRAAGAAAAWLAGRAARTGSAAGTLPAAALGSLSAVARRSGTSARASVARAGAASARPALAARALPARLAGLARPAVVVALAGMVALGAAGWRAEGGPDLLAGEVAAAQAARSLANGPDLLVPDPRVGQVAPVHALAVGVWLQLTGADTEITMEAAVRAARVPSRALLAGTVALALLLSLLLMRVGPGTGAAAGPGPTPPHPSPPSRASRLAGAAAVGLLAAADPLLVRSGRVATATALALLLALATLAVAWAPRRRPARLALLGAGAGLALLASPLALPTLAVPAVAAALERRPRAAVRALAALGLGVALWAALPLWVAGQGLDAERAGWLLGRPPGRGSLAAFPLSWLLAAAGLAAAVWAWRSAGAARGARRPAGPDASPPAERSAAPPAGRGGAPPAKPRAGLPAGRGAAPPAEGGVRLPPARRPAPRDARLLAWVATTGAGALAALLLGWPVEQALPFALPAAAVAVGLTPVRLWRARAAAAREQTGDGRSAAALAARRRELLTGRAAVAAVLALAGLLLAQGVDWTHRYGGPADDALGRLAGTVGARLPACSAVNASGPDDRARLLAAGVNATEFTSGPAAQAAGVRYFALTGRARPALARWIRQHGGPVADLPSPSLSRVQLWHVDADALDPLADRVVVPGGAFSNVDGSACGGYRVLDDDLGSFYTAYLDLGGKAVLGRPLSSVWTSDGPALQAFDTMVLGAVADATGKRPSARPVDLTLVLAKLNPRVMAAAGMPQPSAPPPITLAEVQTLMTEPAITRAYLGMDPATASQGDWRRAGERFGRPLGVAKVLPDGAVRQPFERVVIELPAAGGPARLAPLGQLAVRLGLVPEPARRLEPVPGLPARPAPTVVDPGPFLWLLAGGLGLLALAGPARAVAGRAVASRRRRS